MMKIAKPVALLHCVLLLVGTVVSAGQVTDVQQTWRFAVTLNDKPIGYHNFTLSLNGNDRLLASEARFDVKFLFFDAYRYRHDSREIWRDDCLQRIDASTDDNGRQQWLKGNADAGQLTLRSSDRQALLGACVMTFAYWNPHMLAEHTLLNPQTGDYIAVTIQSLGSERLVVKGVSAATQRYRLAGQTRDGERLQIDVWYDANKNWVALQSLTPKGQLLNYRLL